jgi:predicted transcriptional regulator of viral defense system
MDRQPAIEALSDAAREQAGYVTAAQAKRLGLDIGDTSRLARSGDLRRIIRGVYALPGAFGGSREDMLAAWLRLAGDRLPWDSTPPGAITSHTSAADIHGLGTFSPSAPTFTVARRRFQPPDKSVRLYTARLEPSDWEWVVLPEGMRIPVTRPARTIVDLAYSGEERSHVLDALSEARDRGLIDEKALVQAVSRRNLGRGRGSAAWLTTVSWP